MADSLFTEAPISVVSPLVRVSDSAIEADYSYSSSKVFLDPAGGVRVEPTTTNMTFRTQRAVPKVRGSPRGIFARPPLLHGAPCRRD